MDRDEEIYFNNGVSFNELIEGAQCCDLVFKYNNRYYNITMDEKPCIVVVREGDAVWLDTIRRYDTYEELFLNHVMEDGVHILEALKTAKSI